MSDLDLDEDLRIRAAWLYYMEGLTQDQVAQELGMTRARVLRMLAAARQDGTVQIRVQSSLTRCVALERIIEKQYAIERVIVIPSPADESKLPGILGAMVGAYVADALADNMSIGLGWGQTLSAALSSLPKRPYQGVRVVSLLGGLTRVSAFNPSEFAWRFADQIAAECYLMAAPVFAPDVHTRAALMHHSGMQDLSRRVAQLDLAIVSVGDLSPRSTIAKFGLLTQTQLASLEEAGAVGDVLCRFIDANGAIVDHDINERVIAIHPDDLSSARKLVLASGGWYKFTAILAAIRLLHPNVLLTDEVVAERLTKVSL